MLLNLTKMLQVYFIQHKLKGELLQFQSKSIRGEEKDNYGNTSKKKRALQICM